MSDSHNDLWGSFKKESVLMACDEVRGYEKNRKCNVNTWWWNSGANDVTQKKKEACQKMKKMPLTKKHKMNTGGA